jgi:hypothetical protein
MRKFVLALVAVLSLGLFTSAAQAQFKQGDWELTLTGTGGSDKDLRDTTFGANVEIGKFLSSDFELGVRQTVAYNDSFSGATQVFGDYNFTLGKDSKLVPFVGVNLGYAYGGNTDDHFSAGPEAGLRYFVNDTTFLYGRAAYDFDLNNGFSHGAFEYSIGIGFRF